MPHFGDTCELDCGVCKSRTTHTFLAKRRGDDSYYYDVGWACTKCERLMKIDRTLKRDELGHYRPKSQERATQPRPNAPQTPSSQPHIHRQKR
jgi:hypothetical protein